MRHGQDDDDIVGWLLSSQSPDWSQSISHLTRGRLYRFHGGEQILFFDFPSVPVSWRFKWATSLLQVLLSFPDPAVCNKVNKLLSAPSSFQSISPEDFSHLHDNGAMERQLRICLTSHTNTLISVFLPCRPLFSNKFSRGLGSAEISRPQLGSTLWRWGPTQRDLLC